MVVVTSLASLTGEIGLKHSEPLSNDIPRENIVSSGDTDGELNSLLKLSLSEANMLPRACYPKDRFEVLSFYCLWNIVIVETICEIPKLEAEEVDGVIIEKKWKRRG